MTTQKDLTDAERIAAEAIENIVNSMPVVLMILDDKGAVASVNPALEKVTGYTWQEIVGKRLPEQPFITDNAVEAQQQTIKEISTPIIPIWTKVLMSPLLGSFDSQRMHDLSERLLEETARQKPRVVLLDLSGLAYVDTQVVSEIIRLVTSIKFLGSRTVLSGIGPQIAQSLVRLGVNLEGITTYATLEQALKSVIGTR